MSKVNRRMLIAAGAAAAAAPVSAAESPLRALYHRWQAVKNEYNAFSGHEDEDKHVFEEMLRIEQEAADFEPTTVEDLHFKIIFADDNGDMNVNTHQSALVERAYRAVGLTA